MLKRIIGLIITAVMLIGIFGLTACNTDTLSMHKTKAKSEIEAYAQARKDNYCEDNWTVVCGLVETGKQEVDKAKIKSEIDTAVATAKEEIDKVPKEKESEMTEELARRVKQDFIDTILKVQYKEHLEQQHSEAVINTDEVSFSDYLGFYNGIVVVVFESKYFPIFSQYDFPMEIEGLDFTSSFGYPIRVWNNGNIGILDRIYYDEGLLTKENLETIYYLYRNKSKQQKF